MLDPRGRVFHRLCDKTASMHPPILMPLYQPRPFQHTQVFGHRRQ